MEKGVRSPQLRRDGTFKIVAVDIEKLEFEMLTFVWKGREKSRIYSPYRGLVSRKILEARRIFSKEILKIMEQHGLKHPFISDGFERLKIRTDFKTTF